MAQSVNKQQQNPLAAGTAGTMKAGHPTATNKPGGAAAPGPAGATKPLLPATSLTSIQVAPVAPAPAKVKPGKKMALPPITPTATAIAQRNLAAKAKGRKEASIFMKSPEHEMGNDPTVALRAAAAAAYFEAAAAEDDEEGAELKAKDSKKGAKPAGPKPAAANGGQAPPGTSLVKKPSRRGAPGVACRPADVTNTNVLLIWDTSLFRWCRMLAAICSFLALLLVLVGIVWNRLAMFGHDCAFGLWEMSVLSTDAAALMAQLRNSSAIQNLGQIGQNLDRDFHRATANKAGIDDADGLASSGVEALGSTNDGRDATGGNFNLLAAIATGSNSDVGSGDAESGDGEHGDEVDTETGCDKLPLDFQNFFAWRVKTLGVLGVYAVFSLIAILAIAWAQCRRDKDLRKYVYRMHSTAELLVVNHVLLSGATAYVTVKMTSEPNFEHLSMTTLSLWIAVAFQTTGTFLLSFDNILMSCSEFLCIGYYRRTQRFIDAHSGGAPFRM